MYICHQTDFRQKDNCFLNILFPVHMTLHTFSSTQQLQSLLVPAANNPFDPPQKEFFRKKNKITHLERSGYLKKLFFELFYHSSLLILGSYRSLLRKKRIAKLFKLQSCWLLKRSKNNRAMLIRTAK